MTTKCHFLKTNPEAFAALKRGDKTFEIRDNDRGFECLDLLVLQEWREDKQEYSGLDLVYRISYISKFEQKPGYVVLGLRYYGCNFAGG